MLIQGRGQKGEGGGVKLHSLIGVIDGYGSCSFCIPIFKEDDGQMSQPYPGHWYIRNAMHHKRWRWLVAENRIDRSALMDWEPDVEELDHIQEEVRRRLPGNLRMATEGRIPRYSLEGAYPTWKQVAGPKT